MLIPEEQLVSDITDLLNNELPAVLLKLEEESLDGKRLPSFRYVGATGSLPVGTGFPYALIEIEEGIYTEKDRIVKNVTYKVIITLKLADYGLVWRYYAAIELVIEKAASENWRIHIDHTNKLGMMNISVIR